MTYKRICEWCGNPFETKWSVKKYCSDTCYTSAKKKREKNAKQSAHGTEVPCRYCQKLFISSRGVRYCSDECRNNGRAMFAAERKREAENKNKPRKYGKNSINEILTECKAEGITYAERQRRRTLAMIKKVEV